MDPLAFASLARTRRTSMLVDRSRPVPRDLVEHLCELAQWAPNHKRTWPWQFAVVEGDGRATFGNVVADAMQAYGDGPDKVDKARGKYLRTPATLVVASRPGGGPLREAENRDAVAAGVLVTLRGGGSKPAIFAVPGVYGNVVCYAELARELGAEGYSQTICDGGNNRILRAALCLAP